MKTTQTPLKSSSFSSPGGATEFFAFINEPGEPLFSEELLALEKRYVRFFDESAYTETDLVFARIYLSDISNQKEALLQSALFERLSKVAALSVIEQPPIGHGKVTILLQGLSAPTIQHETTILEDQWTHQQIATGENYTQFWLANQVGKTTDLNSYQQTQEIFAEYLDFLKKHEMNLFEHSLRTWIYVRDIDNHYMGMVDARRELFEEHNLTADTHFLASTGIEGRIKDTSDLVAMDSLSYKGLDLEQITYLEALENLNPTHEYGVTFERGTKISFGDRNHFHISGTASIDKVGDVVHVGNILLQTERTLVNIDALLSPHGATLQDMKYLIVYLRDFADYAAVKPVVEQALAPNTPIIFVRGAVCRPSWLIEMEGIGISAAENPFPILK